MIYNSISKINFENIILTKEQLQIFKRLLNGETVILSEELTDIFVDYSLAECKRIDDDTFTLSITEIGKNYNEYLKKEEQLRLYANIKEWIAIGISIIALIVSIIALAK